MSRPANNAVLEKKGLPSPRDKLNQLLTKGLAATGQLWPDVQAGYAWVHRAAHILTSADHLSSTEVRQQYGKLLEEMRCSSSQTVPLSQMTAIFLKVTQSYCPGLFHCYDVADLPRTNNDLEHIFGSTRYHERRATGRKQASPGLVVRGSCVSLQQLPPSIITSVAPIWPLVTWSSGERSGRILTFGMKLDGNSIVSAKTQKAIYMFWRNSYPREKCGSRKNK